MGDRKIQFSKSLVCTCHTLSFCFVVVVLRTCNRRGKNVAAAKGKQQTRRQFGRSQEQESQKRCSFYLCLHQFSLLVRIVPSLQRRRNCQSLAATRNTTRCSRVAATRLRVLPRPGKSLCKAAIDHTTSRGLISNTQRRREWLLRVCA